MPDQAKADFLAGVHQPGNVFKMALYIQANSPTLNQDLVFYTTTGEITGTGYTAGGKVITGSYTTAIMNHKGYLDWGATGADPIWTGFTGSHDACIIYNTSKSNRVVGIYGYALTSVTAGSYMAMLPAPGEDAVIVIQ